MENRIEEELALLRKCLPNVEYQKEGDEHWFLIRKFLVPEPWSLNEIDIVFFVTKGYPGVPPYGFFVPSLLEYNGSVPDSRNAPNQPPFTGNWRFLSWQIENWSPKSDIQRGNNLECWVRGFHKRLLEGA